jgi:hypothetical protein
MLGVLHPCTRARHDPPHWPSRGPAGGLALDGRQWLPSRGDCLLPVQALSVGWRAQGREALRQPPVFDLGPTPVWDWDGGA